MKPYIFGVLGFLFTTLLFWMGGYEFTRGFSGALYVITAAYLSGFAAMFGTFK